MCKNVCKAILLAQPHLDGVVQVLLGAELQVAERGAEAVLGLPPRLGRAPEGLQLLLLCATRGQVRHLQPCVKGTVTRQRAPAAPPEPDE